MPTTLPSHYEPVAVSRHITRLTAPNPGPMTGHGTNSYVIRYGDRAAIIDPGPNEPSHIDKLVELAGGSRQVEHIFVTHMHPDHSPAASVLSQLCGTPVYGWHPVDDEFQDTTCQPDIIVNHDQLVSLGNLALRCIHTPGHVDNHVCYLLEEDGMLMTGDHIMQGSTVVIIPPHGKMKAYLQSLQLLKNYPVRALAPGHGAIIDDAFAEIDGIIAHRLQREGKVVQGLGQFSRVSLEDLTTVVYDDVDPSLHPIASLSLLAHLLKLQEDGLAAVEGDKWLLKN